MVFDKEKISFYFKGLLCIALIALWSFWFTNSSREEKHKKVDKHNRVHIKKITKISKELKEKPIAIEIKKPVNQNVSEISNKNEHLSENKTMINLKEATKKNNLPNKSEQEFPKLAKLMPTKINSKEDIAGKPKPEKVKSLEMINLVLPDTASATRKALLATDSITKNENKALLRNGVKVEKSKLKPVSMNFNDLGQKLYLTESWLAKSNGEDKESELNIKNTVENLDKVAEAIELAGIVNKPNGETTAIIKNKSNNYIEVLKKGDEYKGLKLLEINKNEILLWSQSLNKTYIKKINTGN